jgi:hypothetical protein
MIFKMNYLQLFHLMLQKKDFFLSENNKNKLIIYKVISIKLPPNL